MILFVFEGGKAEPMVFDSIGELFLSKEELCVLKCEHDLPTLYSNLRLMNMTCSDLYLSKKIIYTCLKTSVWIPCSPRYSYSSIMIFRID